MFDYLVVGAGLFGATVARELKDAGKSVLVLERREHIAGNCFDEEIEGIRVNRYGGHIFHTNSARIWRWINRFTLFDAYEHRVMACYKSRVYSFPPNLLTVQELGVPQSRALELIMDMFYVGYSEKQWGMPFADIPPSLYARVPVRDTYDDRYFGDRYQGLPVNGYTEMVKNILYAVPVEIGVDYLADRAYFDRQAQQVIYSGAIDELYGYDLGTLDYRSLRFENETLTGDFQGCPTMNYTDKDVSFTRIMEWKFFGWNKAGIRQTVITREYPEAFGNLRLHGDNEHAQSERYYPIPTESNRELYRQYKERAEADGLITGGRLGSYQYLNMDQAIGQALITVDKLKEKATNGKVYA